MYCTKPLGANEVVETFPLGRRLAFDAARGRLWVICTRCERWNLTPLEERWEAVETCERIFRGTRVRVSTENIGIARHPEGLKLVRIGEPLRPEFAAWRYGDQFGRRRRRHILYGAAGAVVVGGVYVGGFAVGLVTLGSFGVVNLPIQIANLWIAARTVVTLHPDGGQVIKLRLIDLDGTRIQPADAEPGFKIRIRKGKKEKHNNTWWFEGTEALRFAGAILPRMNYAGGAKQTVQRAVDRIEAAGHPERFLLDIAGQNLYHAKYGEPGYISKMPDPTRLAVEMALHEEQERRALEGELWLLERAWKEAEKIAEISDSLLLPEGTEDFIREHGGAAERRRPRATDGVALRRFS